MGSGKHDKVSIDENGGTTSADSVSREDAGEAYGTVSLTTRIARRGTVAAEMGVDVRRNKRKRTFHAFERRRRLK
jgi:hypothetical protein